MEIESFCACVRVGEPCLELLALSLWAAVFPCSFRFPIVNEKDRRERGLLVLIYPEGSLGITINSQLLEHSTGLHRHCQFVPIREPSLWVSAVKVCLGPTGELPGPGVGLTMAALSSGDETVATCDYLRDIT